MYGNCVRVITIPTNPKVLAKLETLDLGYNDLVFLPPDLDRLKSLRVLKVMNNFLGKVPARICEMELKTIDVSSNPITEPPIETCERGICSMRRYWHCIRLEEQTKTKAVRNQAKQLGSSTAASSGSLSSSGGGATLSTSATSAAAGPALTSQLIMNDNSFQSQQKLRRGFFNKLPKISPQQCTTSIGSARRANASLTSSSGSVVVVDNIGNAPIISSSTNTPVPNLQTGTTDRQIGAAAFSLNYNTNTPSVQPAISSRRQTSVTSNSSSSFGSNSSPQSKPKPKISIVEPVAESSPVTVTPMITAQTALTGPFTTTNDIDQEIMDGAMTKTRLRTQSSDEIQMPTTETSTAVLLQDSQLDDQVTSTVNDTLKVIFVGMAMVGKTTMIRRLIEGNDASVPTVDERTVGVDIYAWEPKVDQRFEHIDSRIQIQDHELAETCGDVDIKFSVWDFAGQHVYHATHELFFSNLALYVLVWDMGATNVDTLRRKVTSGMFTETGTFNLTYESSSDEDDDDANDVNLDLAIAIEKGT
jgi:Ras of Complex, Roc, domain of DAPkinase